MLRDSVVYLRSWTLKVEDGLGLSAKIYSQNQSYQSADLLIALRKSIQTFQFLKAMFHGITKQYTT